MTIQTTTRCGAVGVRMIALLLAAVSILAGHETVHAQTSVDSARIDSARARQTELVAAARARATPPGSVNCGLVGSLAYWGSGAIYVDTVGIFSNAQRSVAVGWCSYLAIGKFDEKIESFVRWSDPQLGDQLTIDPGIEWARQQFGRTRIRFQILQTDTTVTARFVVRTVIESADSALVWTPQAVHTINVSVYKDTARFESTLVPRLASSMRLVASPLEFVRLDGGEVDAVRAKAASDFVLDLRRRLGIASRPGERVLFLYTKSGDGRDLLGFSQFSAAIDGFSAPLPTPFVFGNVQAAGEAYWHELTHAALMAHKPTLNRGLEESVAKALGGTLNRTFAQFVCEERSLVLKPAGVADLPAFFAVSDSVSAVNGLIAWENAFYFDYMITKAGDSALRKLIDGPYDDFFRTAARDRVAAILEIPPTDLTKQVSAYYSEAAIRQRCNMK